MSSVPNSKEQAAPAVRSKQVNWLYMTPFFLMGIPLLRHMVKNDPVKSRRLVMGAIAIGMVHGTWLIMKAGEESEPVVQDRAFLSPHQLEQMRKQHTPVASAPAPVKDQIR